MSSKIEITREGNTINIVKPSIFLVDQYYLSFDSIDSFKLYPINPKVLKLNWSNIDGDMEEIPLHSGRRSAYLGLKAFKCDAFFAKSSDESLIIYTMPYANKIESITDTTLVFVSEIRIEDEEYNADTVLAQLVRNKVISSPVDLEIVKAIFFGMAYFGWDSTDNYDEYEEYFSDLDLPEMYRRFNFPLYRAMAFSKNAIAKLKNGEKVGLKDRELTSWSKTKSRPIGVARQQRHRLADFKLSGENTLSLRETSVILLKLDSNNANRDEQTECLLNFYAFLADPQAKSILFDKRMASEVLLYSNGGFKYITKDDLTPVR